MDEKLLQEVIARVLSDPHIQGLLKNDSPNTAVSKPECLVLVESCGALQALPEIEHRYGAGLRLCVLNEDPVAVTVSMLRITWEEAKRKKSWARIILPVCSTGQLAQFALGLSFDRISEMVALAIKENIPVEIGKVREEFTERTPQVYRDLFAGYRQQVAAYGVLFADQGQVPVQSPAPIIQPVTPDVMPQSTMKVSGITGNNLVPWSFTMSRKKEENTPVSREKIAFSKRLFSIKEAMTVPPYAILQVAKNTVLTPSALDTLKNNKVEVFREEVQCL